MPRFILRLVVALAVGATVGFVHLFSNTVSGNSDLWLAYGSAEYLLRGDNPYAYPTGGWPSNPMPTILAMVPFAALDISLGWTGAVCLALAAGLYAHAALAREEPWRLLVLLSMPALWTMYFAQWGFLLMAIWLTPQLAPLTLIKPHQGFVIGLLHATPRRVAVVVAILLVCFALAPGWLGDWLAQSSATYDGAIPALGFGAAGLLILRYRRDRPALLYAGLLCAPMRPFYDALSVFAALSSWRTMAALVLISWLAVPLARLGVPFTVASVLSVYVPAGALLLYERRVVPGLGAEASRPPQPSLTLEQ